MADERFWFSWLKDSMLEPFPEAMKKGYERFIIKYGEKPTTIVCSLEDAKEEFKFLDILVKPVKMTKGVINYTTEKGIDVSLRNINIK